MFFIVQDKNCTHFFALLKVSRLKFQNSVCNLSLVQLFPHWGLSISDGLGSLAFYIAYHKPSDLSLFSLSAPSTSFADLVSASITPKQLNLSLTPPTIYKRNGWITLYQYRSRRVAPQADVFSQWQNIAVPGSATEQNAVQTISLSSLEEHATYEVSVKACTGPALCSTEELRNFTTFSARKFKLYL